MNILSVSDGDQFALINGALPLNGEDDPLVYYWIQGYHQGKYIHCLTLEVYYP